jgi:hypothetical protein
MPNGWVKLYRKSLDNEIMRDHKAWTLFCWLLLKANDKGQKIIGRYWVSKELGMKPGTFYDVLQRLAKKYSVINLTTDKATIKYTTVAIRNWRFYQYDNRSNNNKPTINQHSYRIENKEKEPFNEKRTKELKEKAHLLIGKKL